MLLKFKLRLFTLFIIAGVGTVILLVAAPFLTTISGLWAIQIHPSLLITDYLGVGGLVATLLNVWLTTWMSIITLYLIKVKFSGVSFAGVLTITGFAFFGKNLWNFIPVWFGFYLYTKIKKQSLSQYPGPFLFSSGIAPLSSFIAFGIPGLPLWASLPLGILAGIIAGFITPMVVSTASKFHQGYNLYSTGFGLGFIAMIFAGILRAFNVPLVVADTTTFAYHNFLFWELLTLSVLTMLLAILLDRRVYNKWFKLLHSPGNIPSDYVKDYGVAATLFNIGSLGVFSVLILVIFNLKISGPMMAAMFTLIAFGSYGKHMVNSTPVMGGLLLATLIPAYSLTNLGPSIALFFVTALAPVAGKFGLIYGIIAGFLHLLISPYALMLQGGFDLYNNGFTAGLVAGVVVVIAQNFPLKLSSIKFKKHKKLD
jgi:hypothetical protein